MVTNMKLVHIVLPLILALLYIYFILFLVFDASNVEPLFYCQHYFSCGLNCSSDYIRSYNVCSFALIS